MHMHRVPFPFLHYSVCFPDKITHSVSVEKGQELWKSQFCPLEKNVDIKAGWTSSPVRGYPMPTNSWCFRYSIRIKQACSEKNSLEFSDLRFRGLENWCADYSNQQELSFEFRKYYINTKTDGKLDQTWHSKLVKTFYFKFCSTLKVDKERATLKTAVKINCLGFVKQFSTTAKVCNKGAHKEINNFLLCMV